MARDFFYIDDNNMFLVDDASGKVKPVVAGDDMNITQLNPDVAEQLVKLIFKRYKRNAG